MVNEEELLVPELYEIGEEFGLEGNALDIFVNFFMERFPKEATKAYAKEWASRFKTGFPHKHMDDKSHKVYQNVTDRGFHFARH